MPRTSRMIIGDQKAVYHVMSRTALDGFPLKDVEKDFMLDLIRCYFSDDEILKRYVDFYGDERIFADGLIPSLWEKLSSFSEFMREIKVGFARFYDRRHNRCGYVWGDRFKSVIVEKGKTLINCLAHIDLNPLRAGMVKRPEEYRWNSLGYHVQTNNRGNLLSTDFGLKEFNVKSKKERIRRYRRYVYEAGAVNQPENGNVKVIKDKLLEKERRREFGLSRSDRFRYRTRYFTDSGVIGSKEFVAENYERFKHLFFSKHEKKPKPIKGLEGMYSLRRLSEVV